MSLYPSWTVTPSVYPDWLGFFGRWINGDIIRLQRELRLIGFPLEELLLALPLEFREMLLLEEIKISDLQVEAIMMALPLESRIELRPKGIA